MDRRGVELLFAAVIEQAVHDRRLAVTRNLVDSRCNPTRTDGSVEISSGLRYFFFEGGLEIVATAVGFSLPIEKIKEKSSERY